MQGGDGLHVPIEAIIFVLSGGLEEEEEEEDKEDEEDEEEEINRRRVQLDGMTADHTSETKKKSATSHTSRCFCDGTSYILCRAPSHKCFCNGQSNIKCRARAH